MISYVVPVYNEEESLQPFYKELKKVILKSKEVCEIVFIDDGSTDSSLNLLKEISKKDKTIRIFSFRKNQGKAEALTLGFQKAKGEFVVTLDADLQDRPSEINKLLKLIKQDKWDVVSGWRYKRKDSQRKVISSKFFNYLARNFWGLQLHDYNCGLKAYTSDCAKSLKLYGGFHRFIPLLAYQEGFQVTEVAIEHDKRKFGISKFGFSKVWKDLPDIFTMLFLYKYSKRPMHFFGMLGGAIFIIGLGILIYLSIMHFIGYTIGDRPLLTYGMLFLLAGLQSFLTGFLADLIINTSAKEITHHPLRFSTDA